MKHLFIDLDTSKFFAHYEPLSFKKVTEKWKVDIVNLPFTQIIEYNPAENTYEITYSIRDATPILSFSSSKTMTVNYDGEDKDFWKQLRQSLADRDEDMDVSALSCILSLIFALGAENYLSETGFWNKNEMPDEDKGGVYITSSKDGINAKIVCGRQRPDLEVFDVLQGESSTARPYKDEFEKSINLMSIPFKEKEIAAENGDPDCIGLVADAYIYGPDREDIIITDDLPEQDFKKAAYWRLKQAELGDPTGMFDIALYYSKGCGVERNFEKAYEWAVKARDAGDTDAEVLISKYSLFMKTYQNALNGDPEEQANLAGLFKYLAGDLNVFGPEEDYKEAFKWAKKSAEQGCGDGIWNLSCCYNYGRGTKVDVDKAIELAGKGAALGNAPCMNFLGAEYMKGENLWKNSKLAIELYEKAAGKGFALAMRNLGACYQFGQGVPGNMKKAIQWFEKSLELEEDEEIRRKVELFKMLNSYEENPDETYRGEPEDSYDDIELQGTQYEGRIDRCEQLRSGSKLQYKIIKDDQGNDTLEFFYNGGSVGVASYYDVSTVVKFLNKKKITLEVVVKSCIPKSQRGSRARKADVKLKFIISDLIPLPKIPLI